jgi:hypothetical protein
MTQIAAIAKSLLDGEVLSIMNGFKKFACTNIPREISRSIEKKFDVEVSRETVEFTSQYKQPGSYVRYRLNKTEYNAPGIARMQAYVKEHSTDLQKPKASGTKVREHTRGILKPQQPEYTNKLF